MATLIDVLIKLNDNLKLIKLNALNNTNSGWPAYNGGIKQCFRQVSYDLKNINASMTDYTQASDQVRNMATNLMALLQNPIVVPKIQQKIAIDILHLLSAANFPMDFPFVMQNGAANNAHTPYTLADLTALCLDQAQAYFANNHNNFYANEFSLMLNYLININTHHTPLLEAKTKRLIATVNNTLFSSLQHNRLLTANNFSAPNTATPQISSEEIIYFLRGNAILGLNADGTYTNALTLNQINQCLNNLVNRGFENCINPANNVKNINKIDFDKYNPMVTSLFQVYDAIANKKAFPESLYKSMQAFKRNYRTNSTSKSGYEQSVRWNLVGVNAQRNNCVEDHLKKQVKDIKDIRITDCNTNTAFEREIDFMVTGGDFKLGIQVDGEKYHTFYSVNGNNHSPDKKTRFRDYCFTQYQYPILIISEQKNNNQTDILSAEIAKMITTHLDSKVMEQCIISTDVGSTITHTATTPDNRTHENATPVPTPLKRDGSPGNDPELISPVKGAPGFSATNDDSSTPVKPVASASTPLGDEDKAEKDHNKDNVVVDKALSKPLIFSPTVLSHQLEEVTDNSDMPDLEDEKICEATTSNQAFICTRTYLSMYIKLVTEQYQSLQEHLISYSKRLNP